MGACCLPGWAACARQHCFFAVCVRGHSRLCGWGAERCPRRRQVDGARPMDEVFANIDGVLSAFIEDHAPAEAAVA